MQYYQPQHYKNKIAAVLFSFFLGEFGIHRFYLGQRLLGIIYLALCWTFIPAVLGVIDGVLMLLSSDEDFDRKYNQQLFG